MAYFDRSKLNLASINILKVRT